MTMETDLVAVLQAKCSRVYPDIAPQGVAYPYVTWQALGGESLSTLANTAIDKRHTLMQINVWAATRLQALQLIREIEDSIRASAAFVASPVGEPQSTYEPEVTLYGSIQRFEIWSAR